MAGFLQRIKDAMNGQGEIARQVDAVLPNLSKERRAAAIDAQARVQMWKKMAAIANSRASMFAAGGWGGPDIDSTLGRAQIHRLGNIGPREFARSIALRRAEGRLLYQRNIQAATAVELWALFVVGNGLNYKFKPSKRSAPAVKKAWNRWAFSTEAHLQRGLTLAEIDAQFERTFQGEGEVLARWHRALDGRAVPLGVEALQTDFISTMPHIQASVPYETVVDGIQRNRYGAPTGMWLHKIHPNDGWSEPEFVPMLDQYGMQQLQLYYNPDAAGWLRGANNKGAKALDLMLDAADARGLRVERYRLESSESSYVTTGDGMPANRSTFSEQWASMNAPAPVEGEDYDPNGQIINPDLSVQLPPAELAAPSWQQMFDFVNAMFVPGATPVLLPGMDIKTREMAPASDFAPFWKVLERGAAAAYGVPYPWLSQDAGDGNMSSNKGIILPFEMAVGKEQESLINKVANITARNFVFAGATAGLWRETEMEFTILGNRFPSVQPDKDIRVLITKLANRLISFKAAAMELGLDPEELRRDLEEDDDYYEKHGWYDRPAPFSISPQFLADSAGDETPQGGTSAGGGRGNTVDD